MRLGNGGWWVLGWMEERVGEVGGGGGGAGQK